MLVAILCLLGIGAISTFAGWLFWYEHVRPKRLERQRDHAAFGATMLLVMDPDLALEMGDISPELHDEIASRPIEERIDVLRTLAEVEGLELPPSLKQETP